MARPEARARIIEDAITEVNMKVNDDGSINIKDISSSFAEQDKLYSIAAEIPVSALNETDLVLFRNPSGSNKVVYLTKISACLLSSVSAEAIVRVYKSPTVTANGTAIQINPARIGGSPPTASSLCTSRPTTSSKGSLLRIWNSDNTFTLIENIDSRIILEPNNSILISGKSTSSNKPIGLTLSWIEV